MRRFTLSGLGAMLATALGLATAVLVPASPAAAYEFTGTFPGGNCRQMAATIPGAQLWYGHFTGRRYSPWNYNFIEGRTADGCFRTKAQCDNWLYQWRSAWQLDFWNDYCVKGWPPAPRGWAPRTMVPGSK